MSALPPLPQYFPLNPDRLGPRLSACGFTRHLISDYVAERYGVNVVVAGGNENDSAVQQAPGALYNGFTVGAAEPGIGRSLEHILPGSRREGTPWI